MGSRGALPPVTPLTPPSVGEHRLGREAELSRAARRAAPLQLRPPLRLRPARSGRVSRPAFYRRPGSSLFCACDCTFRLLTRLSLWPVPLVCSCPHVLRSSRTSALRVFRSQKRLLCMGVLRLTFRMHRHDQVKYHSAIKVRGGKPIHWGHFWLRKARNVRELANRRAGGSQSARRGRATSQGRRARGRRGLAGGGPAMGGWGDRFLRQEISVRTKPCSRAIFQKISMAAENFS